MTVKQKILKTAYPVLMGVGKAFGVKASVVTNAKNVPPVESFYDLSATANNGVLLEFGKWRGKSVLLVNTASGCGYTAQLAAFQALYEQYKDRLVIIGFPANDFANQEQLSDDQIASFCTLQYQTTFLLSKKTEVLKTTNQHAVYQWLSDKRKNGWNDKAPEWNFSKYLVSPDGILTHYFGPGVSPSSKQMADALHL